ncbi:MAG: cysteine desulfurase [Rhodospirillaceae bacterium]|nr:cysteine desulfurase [Rhodospirillaceae bacterium]
MNAVRPAAALCNDRDTRHFDVARVRADFPILARRVRGKPLVFLDSAASAQKPRQVLDAMRRLAEEDYANVHRGVYELSARATDAYEGARARVARFLGARQPREIVFTRNGTEAFNLVAASYGDRFLGPGDEVVLTALEHHSNIVPWQLLRERRGIVIRVVPVDERGALCMEEYARLLGPRTRLVAATHVSNALGTVTPVAEIVRLAHAAGAVALIDGCQAVPHLPVDVSALDCDFYVFTGHKLYGPTGIGVLYAKAALLDAMPPWQGGGDMIRSVTFDRTEYADIPARFEAGTPNIVGAVGLAAAIDYVSRLGLERIAEHEGALVAYGTERLSAIEGVRIVGTAPHKGSILSFVMEGVHPHDIGTILDQEGVAVRTGHHCAQPVMDRFDLSGTVRASFGCYNTVAEVDALAAAVRKVREIFR